MDLIEDVFESVLRRVWLLLDDPALLLKSSKTFADAVCCRLTVNVCSRRSSSSLISGLFISRGFPVPNMLDFLSDKSPSSTTGFERGNRTNGLRPSREAAFGTSLIFQEYKIHIYETFNKGLQNFTSIFT